MAEKKAREGSGHFHWNAGGWYGGQIGSSCWILLAGLLLLFKELVLGLILIVCFSLINLFGTMLWTRRDRIAPYPAVQCLILLNGVFAFFTIILVDHLERVSDLDPRYVNMPGWVYAMLLMFPGMMLMFHLMEKQARKQRQEST